MQADYDPSREIFDPKDSAAAMLEAVQKLAELRNEQLDQFNGKSFAEIAEIAQATYDELPEFWRVWRDWHTPQPKPDMGDL